MQTVITKSQFF